MSKRSKTSGRERYTLEFVGFKASSLEMLELFSRELTLETFHRRIEKQLPLGELLENILSFELAQSEYSQAWEPFTAETEKNRFLLTADSATPEARDKFLAVMKSKRALKQNFNFNYGPEGVERVALSTKDFPWGFRALTSEGHRNFIWDKIDLSDFERSESLSKVVIEIVSVRKGPVRKLYLRSEADPARVDTIWMIGAQTVVAF